MTFEFFFSGLLWVLLGGGFLVLFNMLDTWLQDRLMSKKLTAWFMSQTRNTYRIYLPEQNYRSIAEMEALFTNLTAMYSYKSNKDVFITGKWHEAVSLEVHSDGGKIKFYTMFNVWYEDQIRGIINSHFPGSKMVKVEDPMSKHPDFWTEKDKNYKDMFGTSVFLEKSEIHPLKNWRAFQNAQNEIINDPISAFIAAMENIDSEDYAIFQLVVRPNKPLDRIDSWKEEFKNLRIELTKNAMIESDENGQTQALTEEERKILNEANIKINSVVHLTKFRFGYFVKDNKKPGIIEGKVRSFLKNFTTLSQRLIICENDKTNQEAQGEFLGILGPYIAKVWDDIFWRRERYYRKQKVNRGLKWRSPDIGPNAQYNDCMSLASVWHFPISGKEDYANVSRINTAYNEDEFAALGQAPSNLPS